MIELPKKNVCITIQIFSKSLKNPKILKLTIKLIDELQKVK